MTQAERDKYRKGAILGRQCRVCLMYDEEATSWALSQRYCEACYRQIMRRGACPCGKPMYATARGSGVLKCHDCDSQWYRDAGYVEVILLAPEDDRERRFWRSPRSGFFSGRSVEDPTVVADTVLWRRLRC